MFYSLLNYIASQSVALPTHIVDKSTEKKNKNNDNKSNNDGTLIWATNGSNIVYTDLESGLIKYDFFDVLIKGM